MKGQKKKIKKATIKDDDVKILRCPVCNKKDWDINGPQVQKIYKIQQQRNEQIQQVQVTESVSVQSDNTKKSSSSKSSGNSSGTF